MIPIRDFSLKHTIESGQPLTFYSSYSQLRGTESLRYVTMLGEIEVRIRKNGLYYGFSRDYTDRSARKEVISRFGLQDDMQDVYKHINTDEFISGAIREFHGMHITRNDPWEATLCFVISQFNNLKRIRGIMHNMIGKFGEEAGMYKLFPTPESLADADVKSIRACGTGFRDRYIKRVAEEFAFSFDKKRLYTMKYEAAKEKLMELDGIGDKVADCILLFGYGKMDAFPIDTWVKRVMEHVYFNNRKRSAKQIHRFASRRWPYYRAYAQQYIFWKGRENKIG